MITQYEMDNPVTERPVGKPTCPTGNPMGAPTLYSDAVAECLCGHLSRGMTRTGACALAGIDVNTLWQWSQDKPDFMVMVAEAEAQAEAALTNTLFAAGTDVDTTKGDYKAALEWLKRRRRADYGDQLDIRKLDTADLLKLLQLQSDNQPEQQALEPGSEAL